MIDKEKARKIAEKARPGFTAIERVLYKGCYVFNLVDNRMLDANEPIADPLLISVNENGEAKEFYILNDIEGFMDAAKKTRERVDR